MLTHDEAIPRLRNAAHRPKALLTETITELEPERELSSFHPRVFDAAYRFPLDTGAVNRGLKDGRGRTLVARDVEEPSRQMPLAVIGWHLSRHLEDPLLVIAASPRLASGASPTLEIVIETGFQLLVDALLYVARDHRAWVLERLPAGARSYK